MPKMSNLKKNCFLFVICLLFSVILLGGCASLQKTDQPKEMGFLEPSSALKFSDIPIPSGFVNLAKSSYAFQNNNLRVGLLRYSGKASPEQVVNFYKEQMPMYNWSLINMAEFTSRVLNFEKETETCIVDIEAKGSKCDLFISLGPRSQGSPKAPSKKTQEKIIK